MEEIDADICDLNYLGMIENLFTLNGAAGHGIVMVYDASFVDKSFYKTESFEGKEDDGSIFKLIWFPLSEFQEGNMRLVPENLLGLLDKK